MGTYREYYGESGYAKALGGRLISALKEQKREAAESATWAPICGIVFFATFWIFDDKFWFAGFWTFSFFCVGGVYSRQVKGIEKQIDEAFEYFEIDKNNLS